MMKVLVGLFLLAVPVVGNTSQPPCRTPDTKDECWNAMGEDCKEAGGELCLLCLNQQSERSKTAAAGCPQDPPGAVARCFCGKHPIGPTRPGPPPPSPPSPLAPPSPPAPPAPPTPGPGGIKKTGVTIGGLHCDTIQTGTIFYPSDTSKKYPLLSFAHGWTEGGDFTDGNYKNVLEAVAADGYVVIAHHSGLVTECQPIYPGDQLRALAYVNETAAWNSKVDWSVKTGIYGHSMGGGATGDNAGRTNAIQQHNIGAAVLLHPLATRTPTKIPSFYATGSADIICAPGSCEAWSRTAAKPYIFAEMSGATHFECQSSEDGIPCPAGWTNYVKNWFNCHLKGMQSECDAANSVCTHPTKPMTKTNCQPGTGELVV